MQLLPICLAVGRVDRRRTDRTQFWSRLWLCAIFSHLATSKEAFSCRIRKPIKHHHGPYRGTAQEDPDQAGRRPRLPEGRGECSILPTSTIRVFDDDERGSELWPKIIRSWEGWACSPLLGGDPIMKLATIRPTFAAAPSEMDVVSVGVRRWDHPVPVGRRVQ